jgi:formylglycine-generating enzyme required for sulfatase activity
VDICNLFSVYHNLKPAYAVSDVPGVLEVVATEKIYLPMPDRKLVTPTQGNGYRLPTEREWEYACRALSMAKFSFGENSQWLDAHAVWKSEVGVRSGNLRPNRWGLFDMHGNLHEWCWDTTQSVDEFATWTGLNFWWSENFGWNGEHTRVLRGGSFSNSNPDYLRCANRSSNSPDYRLDSFGFRISRTK